MFTQNVREAFRTVGWLRGVWLRVYAATRVPLAPVYGGFPVATAIEGLIEEHQRVPGNIMLALMERIVEMPKKKPVKAETSEEKRPETNGKCHNGAVKLSSNALSEKLKVS
ncbi:Uncharacterized protein OBRU01_01601 [Operophtera brumata]|uniref:Uncharacterized protein n=1 Tax=Operophtera brumata TaxID=104452 RepID=A0A0L7LU58_OPEBR|nr:Uncharacterized protein OBRU01_01601 [Operophtera brumata]